MKENDKAKRQKILKELVKGYVAIVDGPGCFFVEDWIEMFPDAKVVLGLRTSSQAWLTSVNATIGKAFGKGPMYYLTYFVPEMHQGLPINNLWDAQTKAKIGVGVRRTEFYDFHNEQIRRIVPKDRLLEFQAADGWDPLCKFLGQEKPVGGHPHRNDAKAANQIIKSFAIWGVGTWVAVGLLGWGLFYGVQRMLGS